MTLDATSIGKRIQQQRKLKGLTQAALARKSGLSTMSIRRYENGERIATEDALSNIAWALDVNLEWLLTGTGNRSAAIGNLISSLMSKRDLSTSQLSIATDIPRNRMYDIEFGLVLPSIEEIERIAKVLRYPTDKLLSKLPPPNEEGNPHKYQSGSTSEVLMRIDAALASLNEEGQQKAIERVEELTEIPKYQRASDVPQDPPENKESR